MVELALDHAHDNEVARAYDRGERFDERVKLFQWWGKQLAAAQRDGYTAKEQSSFIALVSQRYFCMMACFFAGATVITVCASAMVFSNTSISATKRC